MRKSKSRPRGRVRVTRPRPRRMTDDGFESEEDERDIEALCGGGPNEDQDKGGASK